MRIILEVEIYCLEYQGNIGVFQKEFDSDILPSLGMKILDAAFEEGPRNIEEIIVRYDEDWCFIKLTLQKIDKKEHLEVYKTMYEPNGWKWSG